MAKSKLEYLQQGVNAFLSGKMYASSLKEIKEESWQRNAYVRGYLFAYNLYLSDCNSLSNKIELFKIFNKEPLDKTIKKNCIALESTVHYKNRTVQLVLPVMTSTQFFCTTLNKACTDIEEVKRKVQDFFSTQNAEIHEFKIGGL